MVRQTLYFLTIILLINCDTSTYDGVRLFEEYDFNSGDYKLYGLLSEGGPTTFTEKVGDFKVADTSTLNQIKQDWKIHLTDDRMACGFSYLMILLKGDSCVNYFHINLDCEYLTCNKGWFKFPADLLNKYEKAVTKVPRQVARAFHNSLVRKGTFDK